VTITITASSMYDGYISSATHSRNYFSSTPASVEVFPLRALYLDPTKAYIVL